MLEVAENDVTASTDKSCHFTSLGTQVARKSTMLRGVAVLGCLLAVLHAELHSTDFRGPYLSGVGNQMSCGGCYGFAEGALVEWFAGNVTGKLIPLSTQFYVDCFDSFGHDINGCNGGAVTDGLKYLITYQYHPYAEDYPYTADWNPHLCKENGVKERKARNALADIWVYDYIPLSKDPQAIREALQRGPVISQMYIGHEAQKWEGSAIETDHRCATDSQPHSVTFVGWQSNNGNPYYILRNSYGTEYGDHGYAKYADNLENTHCNYHLNAFTISAGRRRELEYQIGAGKKNFADAQAACKSLDKAAPANRGGWTLAIVPTLMHSFEVYDMFTETFGEAKKGDDTFNYFWIGMVDNKWVDGTDTNFIFADYRNGYSKYKNVVMNKVWPGKESQRGKWTTRPKGKPHRFMCSRYRAESCPRISQTAVDNAESLTMFNATGDVTKEIDVGTVAVVQCMEGHLKFGPDESSCQSDGTWSELPTCTTETPDLNCKMPTKKDIPGAKAILGKEIEKGFAAPGSTIRVKCAKKHKLVGPKKSECLVDGTWDQLPTCEKKKKKL